MADIVRVYAFVDAGHIRHGIERIQAAWRDLDLHQLCSVALSYVGNQWLRMRMELGRVFVYDAVPEGEAAQESAVAAWLDRNDRLADVHVQRGGLVGERRLRQKEVDVQLAVDALTLATNKAYEAALLLTGDRDFVPIVKAIRMTGALVAVAAFEDELAGELRQAADRIGFLPSDPEAWRGWRLT